MAQFAFGQPPTFKLRADNSTATSEEPGLRSNIINCIALQGEKTTWVGTGQGMAVLHDKSEVFSLDTLHIKDGEPRFLFDSIASLETQDPVVAFSGLAQENGEPFGTGIFMATDGLADDIQWTWFDQPTESIDDSLATIGDGFFNARTVGGKRGNVTYDMDFSKDYLWITNWYGGLRRLDLNIMKEWERVPLPLDSTKELLTCDKNQYSLIDEKLILNDYYWNSTEPELGGNHNHKGFSVLAYGDTVWVGTANGINRGIVGDNGCVDWKHYMHPDDNLSGNWVIGIAKQEYDGKRIIWAVTRAILPEQEKNSVSFTRDDGDTWEFVEDLINVGCNDIATQGTTVLVASEKGLWKTDDGENWELIPPAVEATPVSSDEILNNKVFVVEPDNRFGEPFYWIGTPDGLARSFDSDTDNWQIYRAEYDIDQIYAYPNPFSPYSHNQLNDDGWVRFKTGDFDIDRIEFTVYNFGLEKVYSETFDWQTNPGAVKWNGRDQRGEIVSNGVYFVNLRFTEDSDPVDHFVKLVVVK